MKKIKQSINKCLSWIENIMLSYNRGVWGIYERLRTDANMRVSLCRPDTASEYLRVLQLYKAVYKKNDKDDIYENILNWLYSVQNDNELHGNSAFNFFFIDGSREYKYVGETVTEDDYKCGFQLYPNDNAKIIINLVSLYNENKDARLLEMAEKSANYWISIQNEKGYFYHKDVVISEENCKIPCMTLWMMTAMLALYKTTGKEQYKTSGYKVFNYVKGMLKDGRMLTSYEVSKKEDWRTIASENYIALLCFALCYKNTGDKAFLNAIGEIESFCEQLLDKDGAIINFTPDTKNCSLNTEENLCDLVYTQGFGLNALMEMYYVTKDAKWLNRAKKLSLFLASIQCKENDKNVDGGWRGSYNLKTKQYAGRCNQNNKIDEGGIYSIYVGWCALPILMGMLKLEREKK